MQLTFHFTMPPAGDMNFEPLIAILQEFNQYDWHGPSYPPSWGQHPEFELRMNKIFMQHIDTLMCQPTCVDTYLGSPTQCDCISKCTKADLLYNLRVYAWTYQSERMEFLTHFVRLGFFNSPIDVEKGIHRIETVVIPDKYTNPTNYAGPKLPSSLEVCTNTYRNLFGITHSEWAFIKLIVKKQHLHLGWALENLLPPRGLHRLPITDKATACKKYINWLHFTSKESIVSSSSVRQKYLSYCKEMGVPMIQDATGCYHPSNSDNGKSSPVVSWSTFRRYWNKHDNVNTCLV